MWNNLVLKNSSWSPQTKIYYDNKSIVTVKKNPIFHMCTKYIEVRYHFIYELIDKREIQMDYYNTKRSAYDIFTKALTKKLLQKL